MCKSSKINLVYWRAASQAESHQGAHKSLSYEEEEQRTAAQELTLKEEGHFFAGEVFTSLQLDVETQQRSEEQVILLQQTPEGTKSFTLCGYRTVLHGRASSIAG